MNTLILGGRGLVGSAIKRQVHDALVGVSVEPKEADQVYADITKYETLFKVFKNFRPDVVYLPAAIAHVDACESPGTDVVNVRGVMTVLRLCESFGAKLVYFSSSYVFDGEKDSPYTVLDDPMPVNHYGHQKLTVENLILQSETPFLIIRTVGVYGIERLKRNFAKQVISAIFSGKPVYAPDDQWMNPILSTDLAKISVRLANHGQEGIWHVAGNVCMTKYEFAQKIAGYFGLESMVHPTSSEEMKQKAKRPRNACLDCSELGRVGILVPDFDSGLIRFLSMEFNG